MFERFTDRSRKVVVLAHEEAQLLDHRLIGTEHLLLGLLRLGGGPAADALESLGVHLEDVRAKVAHTVSQATTPATGAPQFTPRAKKVFELAVREAARQGHAFIGEADLLRALLREGEGVAVQVLISFGCDIPEIRVREQMHERVWVDFNSGFDRCDPDGRYFHQPSLETTGSRRDLARLGLELSEGLELQVYMEDPEVDGRPGALVASGVALHRPDFGWLVEIADDAIEWVACD